MNDLLRIHAAEANLRASPSTRQAPLARLPAGHAVTPTAEAVGEWQPCRTLVEEQLLDGFVHLTMLRPPINRAVDDLVEAAGAEYREFEFGTRHETHPHSRLRVESYWLSFAERAEPVSVAWSAAFISFLVKKSAPGKTFRFSGRHTEYLSASKRAFVQGDESSAYWALRLEAHVLRVGDLVGAYRTGGDCGSAVRTYDSLPGDFCAHCDVVVAVDNGRAVAIGGNVSNTVRVTLIPLDAAGHVLDISRRIVVMARQF